MKKLIYVVSLVMLLGIACILPAAADVPSGVDQYWYQIISGQWSAPRGNPLQLPAPVWQDPYTLLVSNKYQENYKKTIWIETQYVIMPDELPLVTVDDRFGGIYTPTNIILGNQTVTWKFQLPWQPDSELIQFSIPDFFKMPNPNIQVLEVGTLCTPVPEPSSLLVLATGLIGFAGFRLKKK